jgi:hypothetical protein
MRGCALSRVIVEPVLCLIRLESVSESGIQALARELEDGYECFKVSAQI